MGRTSGAIDTSTRMLRGEVDVASPDLSQLRGVYVDFLWPLDRGADQVFVPATAVVRSIEGTWVWAVHDGALARVDVRERYREGADVAVEGALAAGDRVVTRGSENLHEGPLAGLAAK